MVRTRIAPSPTGIAHIGTAYMALFNYAFAKKQQGEFLVRIEDTDRTRFVEGAEQVIYDALAWLDIPYTPSFRQSEHLPRYKQAAEQLVEAGHAYYCFCTSERLEEMRAAQQAKKELPHYDRLCRGVSLDEAKKRVAAGEKYVIRMKMPDHEVIGWEDLIRGHVEINTDVLDDQVLLKSDGFPTYHLAVVVDDNLMKITHVMRGEEWISSTPKHILLYRYFGWDAPAFAHMPLLRNPDKTKMSKRKNDVSIPSYKEKGYLPQALRNYLCLLGWSHPEEKDIFGLDEFIQTFTIERMVKSGPIFDIAKLNWMNGKYIREHLSMDELSKALEPFLPSDFPKEKMGEILPLVRDRLVTLKDIEPLTEFLYRDVHPMKEELIGKKGTAEQTIEFLKAALESVDAGEQATVDMVNGKGWNRGAFFMTLRVAVTGKSVTPPLFETIAVLGREETHRRIEAALAISGK